MGQRPAATVPGGVHHAEAGQRQNDFQGQIFTVADARNLAGFAAADHLGRISMWSVNRDSQCGSTFSQTGMLSNTCSGTPQTSLQFSRAFGQLRGSAEATAGTAELQPAVADTSPADAPYPSWSASTNYPYGYKVTEYGEIYQAKWINLGVSPAIQSTDPSGSAWKVLYHLPGESSGAPALGSLPSR